MLWEQLFIGGVLRFHIGLLSVQWGRHIRINRTILNHVECIIDLPDLHTVILPGILLGHLRKLDNPNIIPPLNLPEHTVVVPRPPVDISDFLLGQPVQLMLWVDDDVAAPFEQLLVYLVVSVVGFGFLVLLFGECVAHCLGLCEVVLGVVVFWAGLHLAEFEGFGS